MSEARDYGDVILAVRCKQLGGRLWKEVSIDIRAPDSDRSAPGANLELFL